MSQFAAWWLTLGLGLVVVIVAVVLLEAFYRKVRQIEAGAEADSGLFVFLFIWLASELISPENR